MGEDKSDSVSNQTVKRDFSLVSPCPNSPPKRENPNKRASSSKLNDSGSGNGSSSDDNDAFWKQIAFQIDKLKYETCGIPSCPNYVPDAHLSPVKDEDSDDPFWMRVALRIKELKMQPCGSARCPSVVDKGDASPTKRAKIPDPSGNMDDITGETSDPKCSASEDSKTLERNCLVGEKDSLCEKTRAPSDVVEIDSSRGDLDVNVDDITVESSDPKCLVNGDCETLERNCLDGEKDGQCEKTRALSDVGEIDSSRGEMDDEVVKDEGKTLSVEYLTSDKLESAVSSRLPDPFERKSFGLEKCTGLKGNGSYGSATGLDLLKSCSCSVCTKAAYIWSDLHYQDVKDRLSILMKSQEEASNLAQRYSSEDTTGGHNLGKPNKTVDLETDLMGQWKSLFLRMESILADESSQLKTNFLALNELRDEFKTNVQPTIGMPSYVRPCSSDGSDHQIT